MTMKKIIFASLIVAAVSFAACNKTLDEKVYSKLTPELAFTSGANAQAATDEMYESLHSAFRTPYFYVNDMSTDVCYRSGKPFETLNDNEIMTSSENESYWENLYKVVARANIVLDNIPDMPDAEFESVSPKAQMLAEAHFMRAFAYMCLTDAYYQVPLVTSSTEDIWAAAEYAKLDDIEKVIESDLKAAAADLPDAFDNANASRPTNGAVSAYLCRLYMKQAGRARLAGDSEAAKAKWRLADAEVDKVLAKEGSTYELLPHVHDIYVANTNDGKYNKEIIFAIRATGLVTSGSWDLGLSWTPWDCNYGWSTFSMPLELAWSFEEGDTRFFDKNQDPANPMVFKTYTKYLRTDKPKYANCIFAYPKTLDRIGLALADYAAAHPGIEFADGTAELDAVYTNKYDYYEAGSYNYDTPNNAIVCRLADMMLCKAEIENELNNGPTSVAIALLNRIRTRAFQGDSHNYSAADFSSAADFRNALCDERALEFHSEGLRRPDLIRMGLWKDRMTKYVNTIKAKARQKEINEERAEHYYDNMFVAYPTSFKSMDKLMYMPYPHRELSISPDLANARDFAEKD